LAQPYVIHPAPASSLDFILVGFRWGFDGERAFDWALPRGPTYDRWQDSILTPGDMQRAFNSISSVADVSFNYIGDFESERAAYQAGSDINVYLDQGARIDAEDRAAVFTPGWPDWAAEVALNKRLLSYASTLEPGSWGFATLLWSAGAVAGLSQSPSTTKLSLGDPGAVLTSLMGLDGWTQHFPTVTSFMPRDIVGLQHLFGPNLRTNAGDSLHDISTSGTHYTLWDAGGLDTLSFASAAEGFDVRLPYLNISPEVSTRTGLARPVAEVGAERPVTAIWLMGEMENVTGSAFADRIDGNNLANALVGGGGNDTLEGGAGQDYLRGETGNDLIRGGDGFDDTHGNLGADTIFGGAGADWVVGGQGDDLLFGEGEDDLVYGNLGDDTLSGGEGNDTIRGGQHGDTLDGGAGTDFLSGDRGDDAITGGAGADTFNFFADAGADRVLDFSYLHGDRVRLEPGSAYAVAQVGADAVITVGSGQMALIGMQLSSLPADWIFVG
jgi:Ca2+-binding RTX toxin-like protein